MKSLLAFFIVTTSIRAVEPAPQPIQRFVGIDNVCAWPNLTLMPDGSINTTIFGQPSHGQMAGAAECWNSKDGQFWEKRSIPAPNDENTNRMNVAAGLAKNGDLLVLCSGWTDVKQPQRPKQAAFRDDILSTWVCRSGDGGRTWTQIKEFPAPDEGWTNYIPFGDIKQGADGALHVSCYGGEWKEYAVSTKTKSYRSWHFRSDDDGKTWQRTGIIGPKANETTLLHLGGKKWLAASRYVTMELYRSEDDGVTWGEPQIVTAKNEINGHLLRLADGRILLAYGNRIRTGDQLGVLAKFSSDEGKTWGEPIRIAHTTTWDCGYPSTVQRADGKLVTAWYAGASAYHARYHMGVAIWDAPAKP
ncbi:MAG: exo-alpha-sialidase [Verrucomicrobiaceae bacterium]|nr:exo-alpha-sialidase [Verrucomicrobiaceae bacterium]